MIGAVVPQSLSAQGSSIGISPPNFELQAEPGQVVAQEIVVSNRGEGQLPITMSATGFVPAGSQGGAEVTTEITEIVKWTSVNPKEFILEPDEERAVQFLIDVPADAAPGGHYLSILASLGSGGSGGQGGTVAVGQRIGSLVLLQVAGEVIEDLRVTSFTAPALAAKGPITLNLVNRNAGTIHLRPVGVITIKDTFGSEVVKLDLKLQNVLPGSERAFSVVWDTGWTIGRFTAEYVGIYGSNNASVTRSMTFIVFPWPIVAPIVFVFLLFVIVILMARRRLARTFKVLFGSE